uniref:Uncharacterized protein n=1 Tax=Romanomermis culicivorax TaxID=13658 RepID=A0A915KN43_ROMCU
MYFRLESMSFKSNHENPPKTEVENPKLSRNFTDDIYLINQKRSIRQVLKLFKAIIPFATTSRNEFGYIHILGCSVAVEGGYQTIQYSPTTIILKIHDPASGGLKTLFRHRLRAQQLRPVGA